MSRPTTNPGLWAAPGRVIGGDAAQSAMGRGRECPKPVLSTQSGQAGMGSSSLGDTPACPGHLNFWRFACLLQERRNGGAAACIFTHTDEGGSEVLPVLLYWTFLLVSIHKIWGLENGD